VEFGLNSVRVSGADAETARDISRMSTVAVAPENISAIQPQPDDVPPVNESRTSIAIDVSATADISIPPLPTSAIPDPVEDVSFGAGLSVVADPMSVPPPPLIEDILPDVSAEVSAFDETLQSAAADITLFAVRIPSFCSVKHSLRRKYFCDIVARVAADILETWFPRILQSPGITFS